MDTKKLRQKVLDLAIHGKLVKQDPNDEPASILLDRIRAEKARLVKEGKIKKSDLIEKPISEDEIPFEVPERWVWCRLGDLFNIVSARRVHKNDWRTSGIPFYRTREIGWLADKKDAKTELFIDVSLYEEFKKSGYPSEDDIMMTAVGTVGKTYIVKATDKFYYKDASVLCLENVGKVDPQFVCHVIQSPYFRSMIAEGAGGTTVDTITIIRANDYLFPLPPISEQHRIVKGVDELFEQIDIIERSEKELEEAANKTRDKLLNLAIQGHLVPQDPNDEPAFVLLERIRAEKARLVKEGKLKKKDLEEKPISPDEIPFDIPEGWVWCRIQDVITLVNGRAYKKEELLDKGKYKVLRVGNFFTNQSWYYSDLELEDEKYCYFGDLLYAWSASFGPKIWDGDKTIFHYHIWNVKFDERILYREFLYYFFLYDKKNIQSSTTGSTMIHVAMENMKPRLLPLPPLSEQRRIVTKLEEILPRLKSMNGMTDR